MAKKITSFGEVNMLLDRVFRKSKKEELYLNSIKSLKNDFEQLKKYTEDKDFEFVNDKAIFIIAGNMVYHICALLYSKQLSLTDSVHNKIISLTKRSLKFKNLLKEERYL